MAVDLAGCSKIPPPAKKEYDLSPAVEGLLTRSESLSSAEQHAFISELIKRSQCTNEQLKKQSNLARNRIGRGQSQVCAQQRKVDAGACTTITSAATKVSIICNGDLIAKRNIFFMDTEKVTEAKTHQMLSGDLAIVDQNGVLLFWCYIKRTDVCKFNTQLTGLDKNKMEMGLSIETVRDILNQEFARKEIWGADFGNDLKSLGYTKDSAPFTPYDIQDFYRDSTNRPISLAYLAEHFLGENVKGDRHSSIRDARLTALCHKKMVKFQMDGMTRFSCPIMDELRIDSKNNPKKKTTVKFEKCICGVAKPSKKKTLTVVEALTSDSFHFDDWL